MEDEFFLSSDGSFSAVYDGHGGANVSEYLRRNLYKHVSFGYLFGGVCVDGRCDGGGGAAAARVLLCVKEPFLTVSLPFPSAIPTCATLPR